MGLFLAMPIMAGVKAICMHVPGWQPWANLMGTEHEETRGEAAPPAGVGQVVVSKDIPVQNPARVGS
jgi:hypothetical protein